MRKLPTWTLKMMLIIFGMIFWGVPHSIIKNLNSNVDKKTTLTECKSIEDSIEKDARTLSLKESITPQEYFLLVFGSEAKSRKAASKIDSTCRVQHTVMYNWYTQECMNKMHSTYIERDWIIIQARDSIRDIYEPDWRQDDRITDEEMEGLYSNIFSFFEKLYLSNIVFSMLWLIVCLYERRRRNEKLCFNAGSILLASLLWPYFFCRWCRKIFYESRAELMIRRRKLNPFELLTKSEYEYIKKIGSSLKEERLRHERKISETKAIHGITVGLFAIIVSSYGYLYTCDSNTKPNMEKQVSVVEQNISSPNIHLIKIAKPPSLETGEVVHIMNAEIKCNYRYIDVLWRNTIKPPCDGFYSGIPHVPWMVMIFVNSIISSLKNLYNEKIYRNNHFVTKIQLCILTRQYACSQSVCWNTRIK